MAWQRKTPFGYMVNPDIFLRGTFGVGTGMINRKRGYCEK